MTNTTHNTSTGDSGLPVDPQHITYSLSGDEASPQNANAGHIADRLVRNDEPTGSPNDRRLSAAGSGCEAGSAPGARSAEIPVATIRDLLAQLAILIAVLKVAGQLMQAETRRRARKTMQEHPDWPEELAIRAAPHTGHLLLAGHVVSAAIGHLEDGVEGYLVRLLELVAGAGVVAEGGSTARVERYDWSQLEGEMEQARGLVMAADQVIRLHGEERFDDPAGAILMLFAEACDLAYQLHYCDVPDAARKAGLEGVEDVFAYMDAE